MIHMEYRVHSTLQNLSADRKRWAYGEKDAVVPFVGLSIQGKAWNTEPVTSVTWDCDNNIFNGHIEEIEVLGDGFYVDFETLIQGASGNGWSGIDKIIEKYW